MKEFKKVLVLFVAMALVVAFVPALWATEEGHQGEQEVKAQEVKTMEPVKVNINTASAEELTQLKGVGEKYAEAIVQYREEHGPFTKAEDIQNVPGIGEKTFEANKDCIMVK
jgi:competence protein ComEA